jgi:LysR family transcriptional regulator, glycine cleavage system transcriptional activator
MNRPAHRPLAVGPLRAFEAVARRSSFSAAAEELHLTQPAISRQIKGLEDELGAPLFLRGTRRVELTVAGTQLLRGVIPLLQRLDTTVRQIRSSRGRRHVSISTFASFASLWLLPRLALFQTAHPDIDIRISANDQLIDLDDPDIDLVLRYCHPDIAPAGATRLFGEVVTPAVGRGLAEQAVRGQVPPLVEPADLARHTLIEGDNVQPSSVCRSWRSWLREQDLARLEPQRELVLNYDYQKVQAALSGQGVVLARLPLVAESLERGELVEPFGAARRLVSPFAYWLIECKNGQPARPEVTLFAHWLVTQAEQTRRVTDLAVNAVPA